MFSLTGLAGWGSIPLLILCLGGLLTFVALVAAKTFIELSTMNGKETPMENERNNRTERTNVVKSATLDTALAVGTSVWSGLALSG